MNAEEMFNIAERKNQELEAQLFKDSCKKIIEDFAKCREKIRKAASKGKLFKHCYFYYDPFFSFKSIKYNTQYHKLFRENKKRLEKDRFEMGSGVKGYLFSTYLVSWYPAK